MSTPVKIDVYRASLDVPADAQAPLRAVLSDAERKRMDRIRVDRPRTQFLVARALLRQILGEYLGVAPASVRLLLGAHGKPYLERGGVRFNLSHSHGQVIFAVTRDCEVGVDIEMIRPDVRCAELANRFFSPREAAELMALPADARVLAFFTCWTRKEAFLKAKGTGLNLPLNQFDVSFAPGDAPTLRYTQWNTAEAAEWRLLALDAPAGYVASLAARCSSVTIQYRECPTPSPSGRGLG